MFLHHLVWLTPNLMNLLTAAVERATSSVSKIQRLPSSQHPTSVLRKNVHSPVAIRTRSRTKQVTVQPEHDSPSRSAPLPESLKVHVVTPTVPASVDSCQCLTLKLPADLPSVTQHYVDFVHCKHLLQQFRRRLRIFYEAQRHLLMERQNLRNGHGGT